MFERKLYASYEDYLEDQPSKMVNPKHKDVILADKDLRINWFTEQFSMLKDLDLDEESDIVTLGARFGEEVEALKNLGYKKSYGMDLIETPPHVIKCDMNEFVKDAEDQSFDLIYTNSTDHCWDIENFIRNMERISRKYVYLHVSLGMRRYEVYRLSKDVEKLFTFNLVDFFEFPTEEVKNNLGNKYRFIFERNI